VVQTLAEHSTHGIMAEGQRLLVTNVGFTRNSRPVKRLHYEFRPAGLLVLCQGIKNSDIVDIRHVEGRHNPIFKG